MKPLGGLLAGLLFGTGLVISGMSHPAKIIGFLDFFGAWDPTLLFVMAGALGTYMAGYQLVLRKKDKPAFEPRFDIPENKTIDAPLFAGAAAFGAGWGLSGLCPGPAVVALASGKFPAILFFLSMLAGMALHALMTRAETSQDACG